jgi:pimeloyl-ACP methyl ester carboxylesterase
MRIKQGARRGWRKLWIALASLAGAAVLVEVIAAVRVRHLRAERAPLDGRLYAEIRGQGEPIIFLAGLPGTTAYWDHRFDSLARNHRLIFIDALGFGLSPWPDAQYTLDDHLRALRRTLLAEGAGEHVTFVAHSFGTLLAAYYAARYPAEVDRLYLLGTPVFDNEKEAMEHIRALSSTGGMFSINPIIARESCKLHEAFSPLLTGIVPRLEKDLPPELVRGAMLHTWQSFNGTLRHVVLSQPITIPLARLGGKVTFVHGRADEITSLQRIHTLAARIGARVVETDDDHTSYSFRNPSPIVAAIATSWGSLDGRPKELDR